MASDLTIQGEVVVNSEKAESAFDRVGDKATQMANEVAGAAGKAGQAVDGIGAGAEKGAERFTRAESRISASIKKATTELELLGKTASQKLEFNISDRGLDPAKFEPALKKLREIEAQAAAAQRAASGSMDKMGVSAAQTAAVLRQLPAQFSDIIVSLQGGQPALTVFLQQGSQIKDAFGGAGNALRALGGYVLGLVNPYTLAAAAGVALIAAHELGAKEAREYQKALILSGNAAGTTSGQLRIFAERMASVVGSQAAAAEGLTEFARSGAVGAKNLESFATAAVLWQKATGDAVSETVKKFEDLKKAPLEATLKLNEGMNYLTKSTYEQIKALTDQGRETEAANVAQKAFADTLSQRSVTMVENLGGIERAWRSIKGAISAAGDAATNIGRSVGPEAQLAALEKRIAEANSRGPTGFGTNEGGAAFGMPTTAQSDRALVSMKAQADELRKMISLGQIRAADQAASAVQVKAMAEWDKEGVKYLSDAVKLQQALTRARVQGLEAGKSEKEILARQAEIREEMTKKDSGAASAIKKEESTYANLIASIKAKIEQNDEELRFSGRLTEADKLRIKLMAELAAGAKTLTASHKTEAMAQLEKLDAQEREKASRKESVALYLQQTALADEAAQAYAAESKAREQGMLAVYGYGEGIKQANEALQFELSLVGKSEEARERALAQYRIELELKRQIDAINANPGFSASDRDRESGNARRAANSALSGADTRIVLDGLKELDAYLDPARAQDFGAALRDAFGEAGNSLAQLTNAFQSYTQQQAELAKMQDKLQSAKGQVSQDEYHKREQELAKKSAQAQIGSYASIAGAAKGFFSEHSKGYKAMEAAERAFRLGEMALALESMTKQLFGITAVKTATVTAEVEKTGATVAGVGTEVAAQQVKGMAAAKTNIANAAGGDPYTAFVRMAAMAAAMAALGFAVSGSSGVSTSAVREQRQATQGTGTVFGDSDAKSGSIGNAFSMLEDSAKLELRYQSGMLASLRNIENSMAGVANAVLRTQGITSGNATGVFEGILSTNKGDPILNALGAGMLNDIATSLPLIGGVIGKLQSLWGKTKQEITDSGLVINGIVADLSKGVGFSQYADVTTTKSSFFGLSKSSKSNTIFSDLDQDTNEALGRVFRSLTDSLQTASGALGLEADTVASQIAATIIDIPRVSLRDLKGDDLKEAISSTISAAADTMAEGLIPGLKDFQQVGEGYFETIVRVSAGIESADYALERFGITAVSYTDILSKQGDVAAEIFRDSVTKFEGAGSGMAEIINGISGTVDDLSDTYTGLIAARNFLKSVGANGSDPTFDLLRGAGGLEGLQDGLDSYLEGFFSETERYAAASARLGEQFATLGVPQPKDVEGFRALATSLDLNDAASAQLFGRLMTVADAFYQVANAVTESENALKDAFDSVASDWLSGPDLKTYRAGRISDQLGEVGLSVSGEQILGMSEKQFQDLYYAIDKTTMAGREQATVLLNVWDAFKGMSNEAAQAFERAQDAAFAALQRATNAQITSLRATASAAQESLTIAEQMFKSLGSNIRALRAEGNANSADSARQYITQAVSAALRTGYLPDADQLAEAISTARGGMDASRYASQFEMDRDRLVLAGELEKLQGVAGKQKTIAEQALDAANEQIDYLTAITTNAKDQLDVLRGIDNSILSVADALAVFTKATGKTPTAGASGSASGAVGGATFGGSGGSQSSADAKYKRPVGLGTDVGYRAVTDAAEIAKLDGLSATYHKYDGTGDLKGLWADISAKGGGVSELSALTGLFESDWRKALAAAGIPGFARGTNYVPYDMPAVVHAGERIIPAGDNRALEAAVRGGGDSGEVVSALHALREENRLQAGEIARLNLRVARVLEKWDVVGQPAQREEEPA